MVISALLRGFLKTRLLWVWLLVAPPTDHVRLQLCLARPIVERRTRMTFMQCGFGSSLLSLIAITSPRLYARALVRSLRDDYHFVIRAFDF